MRVRATLSLMAVLAVAAPALARVGGGQTFSSGGGSSGGGGGGGAFVFDIIWFLLRLCIDVPVVGIPLVLILIFVVMAWYRNSPPEVPTYQSSATPDHQGAALLWQIKDQDQNFSRPVFMDFATLVYTRTREAQGARKLEAMAPYVAPPLLAQLQSQTPPNLKALLDVVIGSAAIVNAVDWEGPLLGLQVAFTVNYVEEYRDGPPHATLATEVWTFRRKLGVQSKAPDAMRALACPSCGAAVQLDTMGKCQYCGKVVNQGDYNWVVYQIDVSQKGPRPPLDLASGGDGGVSRLPMFDPVFGANRKKFMASYPDFNWEAFQKQVQDTFLALQAAWTSTQWEKARPFETDNLFNNHRFWIERYIHEGLRNKLEDIGIDAILPVRIESDRYYDAITVRIVAHMRDSTVDKAGKVMGGDPNRVRPFCEYWTFLRAAGFKPHQDKGVTKGTCPNCGAPLDVSMTGTCKYCNSVITTGQFGWVVSAIDQAETYRG